MENGENKCQKENNHEESVSNEQDLQLQKGDYGLTLLKRNEDEVPIELITIIGEIEGHDINNQSVKTTKYEHLLPALAALEDHAGVKGVLILLNTVGGDVSCGLALAEMIASLQKPTVSLVIGDSHSIGVPLAVATDYSFIVPSGTMLIHPVRMNGMIIGAKQTYDYFRRIQDRITGFIAEHSRVSQERLVEMMMETGEMTKDLGTLLIGKDAVEAGLVNEVGGIHEAMTKLREMIQSVTD